MTRKYTKINKKRISKRSKRINNKSKKLSKKIQKGGDEKKLEVSDNIENSLKTLGQFKKQTINEYYSNYYTNYTNYTASKCNSDKPKSKKDCESLKKKYEENLLILKKKFFKAIRNVLMGIRKKNGENINKIDIDNLKAIVKFFFQEVLIVESGKPTRKKQYKFIYEDFDLDTQFPDSTPKSDINIFYNTLKESSEYKLNPNNGYPPQTSQYTDLKKQLTESQDKLKNTIYTTDKRIIKDYVDFLLKIILDKINSLTPSSTTSTTPQQQQQQQPQQPQPQQPQQPK